MRMNWSIYPEGELFWPPEHLSYKAMVEKKAALVAYLRDMAG